MISKEENTAKEENMLEGLKKDIKRLLQVCTEQKKTIQILEAQIFDLTKQESVNKIHQSKINLSGKHLESIKKLVKKLIEKVNQQINHLTYTTHQ